jgi:hypothetical protein
MSRVIRSTSRPYDRAKALQWLLERCPTTFPISPKTHQPADLCDAMSGGECRQTLREDGLHSAPVASRPKFHAFEILKDRAHAQAEAMESLMFVLEPQSADEALSMVLLADSAFQAFAVEGYRERDIPAAEEALWNNVTRARHDLVRWLHRGGAARPLLADHFNEDDLQPPSERTAEALVVARSWRHGTRRRWGSHYD